MFLYAGGSDEGSLINLDAVDFFAVVYDEKERKWMVRVIFSANVTENFIQPDQKSAHDLLMQIKSAIQLKGLII